MAVYEQKSRIERAIENLKLFMNGDSRAGLLVSEALALLSSLSPELLEQIQPKKVKK